MLQMEIATWEPRHREEFIKDTAYQLENYVKKNGPLPLDMRNPQYKPGAQQLWWDLTGNRSFCLWYEHFSEPKPMFDECKQMLDIMNFEFVSLVQIDDVLADAGLIQMEDTGTLPRIHLEIATWPAENRAEIMKRTAPFIKEFGAPPASMSNPQYKPGIQQIWWDMGSNRSFSLLYDMPGFNTATGILKKYKLELNLTGFELVNVIEVKDLLADAGLL